jgi:hypothetical protein
VFPFPEHKTEGGQKDEDDDVLAEYLEGSKSPALDETVGKYVQENRREQKGRNHEIDDKLRRDVQPSPDEERGDEERETGQVTEGDPELRRQIGIMLWEDPEALVGEGMDQLQGAGEQKSDAEKEQVMVFLDAASVPGEDEDHEGDDDAEELDESVEKQVAVKAARVQPRYDKEAGSDEE